SSESWLLCPKYSATPLQNAVTVFTDAGRKSRKASIMWQEQGQWHHEIMSGLPHNTLQTLELLAIIRAFCLWLHTPLNIISDSLHVVGIVQRKEDAAIRETTNPCLTQLFV
ncbi:PO113 protein, partial [Furnarius figulus]|nr:PO113 protein [Furnarius figulus]